MKSRWFPAVAVLVPLSVVGCGIGGGSKPGAAKAAYITQVDVVCKDVLAKSASIGNAQDQATAQKQADLWQEANNRIKAIPIPGESVEQARQFVIDTNNLSMGYTAAANAIAAGTGTVSRYFADIANVKKAAAETADKYGFKECTAING